MTTRNLERSQWKDYFDRVSHHLPATEAELRVDALSLGDQVAFDAHASLLGIDYDPNDDALEVATDRGTSHRIDHPKAVLVDESAEGLRSVEVIDPEGRQHIVVLRHPLQLRPD